MKVPETDSASIVMIGSFNPAIFQPRWLGTQQLIRPEEAENAKITIVQAEVADFSTEWFQLQVLQNRLSLSSADPRQYSPLRDLAAAIFAILPHTPITAIGLNREFHFQMPSSEAWHGIGHLLAPKEPWGPIMEAPGLRSMTMQGRRKQGGEGILRIKVEPSLKVEHGLYVGINEEFRSAIGDGSEGAQWVPDRLAEYWDATMRFAEDSAEHLLSLVKH
jgi:hypothetical protein